MSRLVVSGIQGVMTVARVFAWFTGVVLSIGLLIQQEPAAAQGTAGVRDPSAHGIRFVTVESGVRLEVLDRGGPGRPIVLLTGMSLTAHVYDDLAPKLTAYGHVYAVTRRGFGASSRPATGYSDQRLADDVLAVLNELELVKPVLVGHSLAGGELAILGRQHSDRLAGLVFLEALDDPEDELGADPEWMRLLQKLPRGFLEAGGQIASPPPPDYSSFRAYQNWQLRNRHYALPEPELRQQYAENRDGSMGAYKGSTDKVEEAIGAGVTKRSYGGIGVPVLAIRGLVPPPPNGQPRQGTYEPKSDEERTNIEAFNRVTASHLDRWVANLVAAVSGAHVVDFPGAGHYVFLTRETDVVREIQMFLARVP